MSVFLPFKNEISFKGVVPGELVTETAGGLPHFAGEVIVSIEGDTFEAFSVLSVETDALLHDPDAPRGSPKVWETVLIVDGAGPIRISQGEALLVTVGCICPLEPTQAVFEATAIVTDPDFGPPLLRIPVKATVRTGTVR